MKNFILSVFWVLLLCGFVEAETVEFKGQFSVLECESSRGNGSVGFDCNNAIVTPPRPVYIQLTKRTNIAPPHEEWSGSWVNVIEKEAYSFYADTRIIKFVNTEKKTKVYQIEASLYHSKADGTSEFSEPITTRFWVNSMDEINRMDLEGNTEVCLDDGSSERPPAFIQLKPRLTIGPK